MPRSCLWQCQGFQGLESFKLFHFPFSQIKRVLMVSSRAAAGPQERGEDEGRFYAAPSTGGQKRQRLTGPSSTNFPGHQVCDRTPLCSEKARYSVFRCRWSWPDAQYGLLWCCRPQPLLAVRSPAQAIKLPCRKALQQMLRSRWWASPGWESLLICPTAGPRCGQQPCQQFVHSPDTCLLHSVLQYSLQCANVPWGSTPNSSTCPNCFCYVCNAPAPCQLWADDEEQDVHCNASERDSVWQQRREAAKAAGVAPAANANNAAKQPAEPAQAAVGAMPEAPQLPQPALVQPVPAAVPGVKNETSPNLAGAFCEQLDPPLWNRHWLAYGASAVLPPLNLRPGCCAGAQAFAAAFGAGLATLAHGLVNGFQQAQQYQVLQQPLCTGTSGSQRIVSMMDLLQLYKCAAVLHDALSPSHPLSTCLMPYDM